MIYGNIIWYKSLVFCDSITIFVIFQSYIDNTVRYSDFYLLTKISGDPENRKMVMKSPLFSVTVSRFQCIEHCMKSRDTSALLDRNSLSTRLGLIN